MWGVALSHAIGKVCLKGTTVGPSEKRDKHSIFL